MKKSTIPRKKEAMDFIGAIKPKLLDGVILQGKSILDTALREMGKTLATAIFFLERDDIAGEDYKPKDPTVRKWSGQMGSIYIGDRKEQVFHPRLRGPQGEIHLRSYEALKNPDAFSEKILNQWLVGCSGRRYADVVEGALERAGVSPSSVSRHLIAASTEKLKEFRERSLTDFRAFAIFIDSVHRGKDMAFATALGVGHDGSKRVLGFWEGATENATICRELLGDLERRGLSLHDDILYITDGGKGIIRALKDRHGRNLLHQRCVVHKLRNIVGHLPRHCRAKAKMWFNRALGMTSLEDAEREIASLERWLRSINNDAAQSLREGRAELLTLHRLVIHPDLRVSLKSTNAIESLFSGVRYGEKNIKRYRSSAMAQRWLAAVLLDEERRFRKIKGHRRIKKAMESIAQYQKGVDFLRKAA